jgi:Flp pilus assembly protein TadB
VKQPPPPCPACGSSATLPFESGDPASDAQPVAEVVLSALFFFLSLLVVLLFFLLSHASLPAAILAAMTIFLFWRRQRERHRQAERRPHSYVCLDCSRSFRAQ